MNLPFRLEDPDLSVTGEVELKDEIVYTPTIGVARGEGTMRNDNLDCILGSMQRSLEKKHVVKGQLCPKVK